MIHQQDHIRGKAEAKVYGTAASPLELPKYRIPGVPPTREPPWSCCGMSSFWTATPSKT